MSDLNGPPPEPAAPSAAQNLKSGLTGSPAAKLKMIVFGAIILGIAIVIYMGTKKSGAEVAEADKSKVAVAQVKLEDEDQGATVSNKEVDSLISQVEKERQQSAIAEGETYVAPVPDLDSTPKVAPTQQQAPVAPPATVSLSSQQAKLAALQGLDGKLAESKYGVPGETRFEQPPQATTTATAMTLPPGAPSAPGAPVIGLSVADQKPVKKQFPAGTIWYAATQVAIDSDVPGPIKARIEQGPYAGGTVLGSYEVTGRKYVTMSFSKIIYDGMEIPVEAIGLNPNNGLAGIEGDVDNHWGQRLILPTLAAAVGKYAEAATFGGTTSVTSGGSVVQQPELSDKEKLTYALGSGVQTGVGPVLQEEANSVKRQVSLPSNTSFGLMLITGI